MLKKLIEIEGQLPDLLHESEWSNWNSLDINYQPPRVERLWRQIGENRLYLHKIHPCTEEQALLHPHSWPSAMRVLFGHYRMKIGSSSTIEPPNIVCDFTTIVRFVDVFRYEMIHPDGWHSVIPIDEPAYTIMLTGKPWVRPIPEVTKEVSGKCLPLTNKVKEKLLETFQSFIHYASQC